MTNGEMIAEWVNKQHFVFKGAAYRQGLERYATVLDLVVCEAINSLIHPLAFFCRDGSTAWFDYKTFSPMHMEGADLLPQPLSTKGFNFPHDTLVIYHDGSWIINQGVS